MKNGTGWTKAEVPLVQSIYEKYKKMYPYEQDSMC
jgi:transposase